MMSGFPFEACLGSITGYDHTLPGKPGARNNQDAAALACRVDVMVGAVFDGCGSGAYSEFGARLAAKIVPRHVAAVFGHDRTAPADAILATASARIVRDIEHAAWLLAEEGDRSAAIEEHLLFTILGFAATPERVLVFGAGDGVWAVNGELHIIDQQNRPAYLGYAAGGRPVGLTVLADLPADQVETLCVATDGAADIEAQAAAKIPGQGMPVGPLAQFWTEDLFFRNADAVRRRLAVLNQDRAWWDAESRRLVRHPGFLRDDTSLVALRRVKGGA